VAESAQAKTNRPKSIVNQGFQSLLLSTIDGLYIIDRDVSVLEGLKPRVAGRPSEWKEQAASFLFCRFGDVEYRTTKKRNNNVMKSA